MFKFTTPSYDVAPVAGAQRQDQQAMEDILMEADFVDAAGDGAGPSRAQALGGGRVTGPGESIADAGKWMRYVVRSTVSEVELIVFP